MTQQKNKERIYRFRITSTLDELRLERLKVLLKTTKKNYFTLYDLEGLIKHFKPNVDDERLGNLAVRILGDMQTKRQVSPDKYFNAINYNSIPRYKLGLPKTN